MGAKKKILLGWLALELATLPFAIPAFAQIIDRVSFSVAPRAAHVELPQVPGKTLILVASNAPFAIISKGAIGEMDIDLAVSGNVNGKNFGTNAQNPGPARGCVFANSAAPAILYIAQRKTAANRGAVIDQAVMIEISYDPALKPEFIVKTLNTPQAKSAPLAPMCTLISS